MRLASYISRLFEAQEAIVSLSTRLLPRAAVADGPPRYQNHNQHGDGPGGAGQQEQHQHSTTSSETTKRPPATTHMDLIHQSLVLEQEDEVNHHHPNQDDDQEHQANRDLLFSPCESPRCSVGLLGRRWSVYKVMEDDSCDEVCAYRLNVRRLIDDGYTCGTCEDIIVEDPCASSEFTAFSNGTELQDAVNAYLANNSELTELAKKYGHPIGAWCVGKVEDFSSIFEDKYTFNEDIAVSKNQRRYCSSSSIDIALSRYKLQTTSCSVKVRCYMLLFLPFSPILSSTQFVHCYYDRPGTCLVPSP